MEPDQELVYGWLGLNPALLLDPSPISDNLMVRVVRPGEDPEMVLEEARQQLASSGSRRRRRGRGGSGESAAPASGAGPAAAFDQANPYAQASVYAQASSPSLGRSDGREREEITVTVSAPSREPLTREPAMVEITPFAVDDFAPIPVLVGAGGIDGSEVDDRGASAAPARVGRSRGRQALKSSDRAQPGPAPVVIDGSPLYAADSQAPDRPAAGSVADAGQGAPIPLTVSITPDPKEAIPPPVEPEAELDATGEPRRRRRRSSASD
jgi:ribonuclease E